MRRSSRVGSPKHSRKPGASNAQASEYRVGPGRPPREYQFTKGKSGNPKGASRRTSIAPDLKASLERALNQKVTLRQGDKETTVTKAAAGIEQLVNQFAKGDRYARRDLMHLAGKLGVDLVAGQDKVIEAALEATIPAEDQALLADYVRRQAGNADPFSGDPLAVSEETPTKPDHTGGEETTS